MTVSVDESTETALAARVAAPVADVASGSFPWTRWLGWRLGATLLLKLLALYLLWWLFFAPALRPAADAAHIGARMFAPAVDPTGSGAKP
jgi:hypothetical protein